MSYVFSVRKNYQEFKRVVHNSEPFAKDSRPFPIVVIKNFELHIETRQTRRYRVKKPFIIYGIQLIKKRGAGKTTKLWVNGPDTIHPVVVSLPDLINMGYLARMKTRNQRRE